MKLDLRREYQKIVRDILGRYLPGKEIWVYGSRIKGCSHDGSDLDLVVKSSVTQTELSKIRAIFLDSQLPIKVDIVSWENIPDAFKAEIEKQHEIFV